MVTTQTADNALKSYYLEAVTEQLNLGANPFLAQIRQSTADVWGKDVRKLVRIGMNGGIGAGTEDGALPTAGSNRYALFVSTLKNLYGTIEISDKAIRASQNNEGAFVNLLNDEMEGLVRSSSFNFGRMLFGDGSGTLAKVKEGAGPLLSLDTATGIVEGLLVDVLRDGEVIAGGRSVESVDYLTKAVILSGEAIADPAGCTIAVQNSYGMEITGLGAIFSDSAKLYGLERGRNAWLTPYSLKNTGALTENKIQRAIDRVEEYSGSKVNFILCSWGVRRALVDLLSKNRRTESLELAGGYRTVAFNGIPVVADRFCPEGTMYLLNTDDFCLHQLCDWQWLEGEDGKILRQKAGKPVFTATLVKYAELLCTRPCGQAMLSGITEA